ncbi:MAG: heat shock protein DnaJ domain-containing protein [Candidatus Magnetoglobus multicellularis str. Araruama]|uniref:Heat shock protein DnaJ domain-containing protein n=1 Tax=Candidatus Magnetoglobus multicellularis str. Araruama TaxID=890399 RepID=A0A1V1P0T2_9BACT|nr:MAG: heat shock protein DnaJ domain-containing protein [Candidatus Magnetoglobus multicellularis str. Araruama]
MILPVWGYCRFFSRIMTKNESIKCQETLNNMSQNTFENHLAKVSKKDIQNYLATMTEPCYESTLLHIAFPEMNIIKSSTLELYQHHFVLFHLLYQLQEMYAQKNQYLRIHFMRTCLIDYPETGYCRHFDDTYSQFCNEICEQESLYCEFHRRLIGETELDSLSMRYFYQDTSNYYKLDEKTAELFVKGTWEILSNYDLYKKALKF